MKVSGKEMNSVIKNGYEITALTLGTVQLGLAYGVNNAQGMPTFEESSAILNTALDSGIVSFDTARGYGESEAVLGRFFRENPERKKTLTYGIVFVGVRLIHPAQCEISSPSLKR